MEGKVECPLFSPSRSIHAARFSPSHGRPNDIGQPARNRPAGAAGGASPGNHKFLSDKGQRPVRTFGGCPFPLGRPMMTSMGLSIVHVGNESTAPPTAGHVFGLSPDALADVLSSIDARPYRARQVLEWAYRKGAAAFDDMTNLPLAMRAALAERLSMYESTIVATAQSKDSTKKLLLRWPDGATSECVMIPDGERRTACISTQVGCPVGCVFCASGIGGLERNLTAGQIVEQAMRVAAACDGDRLSNVVFMGLGEPLANYDATVAGVRTINADWGMNIGARKITVSTVGLPKQMRRLAEENLQVTLALSLHAPNDELRRRIIPWAESIPLAELIDAARYYFDRTGREVTLEYILLADVNDSAACARELAAVSKSMRSNVNLIPYNPVAGLPYRRPTGDRVQAFERELRSAAVNAHVRRPRGDDVNAACGQLRRERKGDILLFLPPPA